METQYHTFCVAMRGREGGQRLEPNLTETTNTITTVTKDNLILEIKQIGNISPGTNRDNPNQGRVYDPDGLSPTLLGNIYGDKHGTGHAGNVWSTEGICPTLNTAQGGNRMPLIIQDLYYNRDIPGGSYKYLIEENDDKDKTSN